MRWRYLILVCGVWLAGSGSLVAGLWQDGALLIRRGQTAPVWVAADAAAEELAAAEDLARVLGRMAGTGPATIAVAPRWRRPDGVHIGRTPAALGVFPELRHGPTPGLGGKRDRDTALIAADGGRVVLAGYDAGGTVLAVYRFLQVEGGVRWLFPGSDGELVPVREHWRVSETRRREVPGFLSREFFFGSHGPDEALWLRRNLLRPRASFHHRVDSYTPAVAFSEHPEWFASFPEGPRDPRVGRPGDWQPNFGHPEVSTQMAAAARRAWQADSERMFFPVSPNDSVRFGALPGDATAGWFRRHPNVSGAVFGAVNAAAAELRDEFPDRYLGMLAYHWYESPPPFAIEPNVAIYLALDRFQGRRPSWAQEDVELATAWAESGAGLVGLYDYMHGSGQATPRVWPRLMTKAWQEAQAAGVRGLFVEVAPHWGWQGLQPWLAAQVAWDPTLGGRTVDEVWEDGWRALAGDGAPYLKAVFRQAELIAIAAPGDSRWLPDFREPDQLALYPESFWRTARAALVAAQEADPAAADRLERLFAGPFALGTALAAFDLAREDLRQALADGLQGSRLERRWRSHAVARAEVERLTQDLATDPLHARAGRLPYLLAEDPTAAAEAYLWRVEVEPVWGFSQGGLEQPGGTWTRSDGGVERPMTAVRDGLGDVPMGWFWEGLPAEGLSFGLTPEAARAGAAGFRMTGVEAGLLATWAPAEAGQTYRLTVPVHGRRPPGAVAVAVVAWYGADNRPVAGAPVRRERPARGERATWREIEVVDTAPAGAVKALVGLSLRFWSPGQTLDVDEVSWERLGASTFAAPEEMARPAEAVVAGAAEPELEGTGAVASGAGEGQGRGTAVGVDSDTDSDSDTDMDQGRGEAMESEATPAPSPFPFAAMFGTTGPDPQPTEGEPPPPRSRIVVPPPPVPAPEPVP